MKRKTFLKSTASAAAIPFLLNSLPVPLLGKNSIAGDDSPERILVLIELDGGNDGLNTVIPLDKYANLMTARKNILIPDSKVLPLGNAPGTGLHPSLAGLMDLYDNKMLTIIQGVGYPVFNFSHFRAADIWFSGSDSDTVLSTGWLGRFLDKQYPGYPSGYPNSKVPYPLAIRVGPVMNMVLQGPAISMGIAITSDSDFYDLKEGTTDLAADTPAGYEQAFIKETSLITQQYTGYIKDIVAKQKNQSKKYPEPGNNKLADQLKMVAQMIGSGLQTQVYVVTQYGYDTHNGQTDKNDPTSGMHANLLKQLSEAIVAFEDDLQLMCKQDNVIGMTFSEFGRRIKSNDSYGTDHGSSKPVILFGSGLKGGLIGSNPVIPAKAGVDDNLPMEYDYRSVFASVLKGWFGATNPVLDATMLAKYPQLDLFRA